MIDWGDLYAHVIACTGWTWCYIADHLDLPRLEALNKHWANSPPVHSMVAAYLGIKPKEKPKAADLDDQDVVPVSRVSKDEFEELLKSKGLAS